MSDEQDTPVWEVAWEQEKDNIGRELHQRWKDQHIAEGYADHAYTSASDHLVRGCQAIVEEHGGLRLCETPLRYHDSSMKPWEELDVGQRLQFFGTDKWGFKKGYERGRADGYEDGYDAGLGSRLEDVTP